MKQVCYASITCASSPEDIPLQFIVGAAVAIGVLIIIGLIFLCVCRQHVCGGKYTKGYQTPNQTSNVRRKISTPPNPEAIDNTTHLDGVYQQTLHPWFHSPNHTPVSYLMCGSDVDVQNAVSNNGKLNTEKVFYEDFQGNRCSTSSIPVGITTAYCPTMSSCQLIQPLCNGSNYISAIDPQLFTSNNASFLSGCPTVLSNPNIHHGPSHQVSQEYLSDTLNLQTCEVNGNPCLFAPANAQLINAMPPFTTLDLTSGIPTQLVAHSLYSGEIISRPKTTSFGEHASPHDRYANPETMAQSGDENLTFSPVTVCSNSTAFDLQPELHGVAYILDEHTTNV